MNVSDLFVLAHRTVQTLTPSRQKYRRRPFSGWRLWRELAPNLKNPIFIIGSPRSGTTFLGDCLAVLKSISYHYEPSATKFAARLVYEKSLNEDWAKLYYKSIYEWLMRVYFDGDLRFAEKTPQNCFIVPFLYELFPDAKFIHIIRDGRDAALSHSKKPWLQAAFANSGMIESGGHFIGPYARFWVEADRVREFETTTDIHRCIWAWRRFVESALLSASALSTDQHYEVRYESLVQNPDYESEKILDFLKINDLADRHLFKNAAERASTDSIGKWRFELSEADLSQIYSEAGVLLYKLGYYEEYEKKTAL